MTRLFETGTFVSGPWIADVIRIQGPGGPALNPRVHPHGHPLLADFLRAVLPLESGRLTDAVVSGQAWTLGAIDEKYAALGIQREGWHLLPHGPDFRWMLAREGDEAEAVDAALLLRSVELYGRSILPLFEGRPVATNFLRKGQASPWVGVLRRAHGELEALLGDDRFRRVDHPRPDAVG